jgi:hypothetical protein
LDTPQVSEGVSDNVEQQPHLGTPQVSEGAGLVFPWKSERTWEKLGMSRSAWWRAGQPKEKPAPATTNVVHEKYRRTYKTRAKPMRSTTPQAQAIRDAIKELWETTKRAVKVAEIEAALAAKGIKAKSRNNVYYHMQAAVEQGIVPPQALDVQIRKGGSKELMAHVVRLATPAKEGDTTSVPGITLALIREGHLPGDVDAANGSQKETVRRYVDAARKSGAIKPEWIHNGHRSEKRERVKAAIPAIVADNAPVNVRSIMYKLIDAHILTDKDDGLVSSVSVELRDDDTINPDDIVDIRGTIHHREGFASLLEHLEWAEHSHSRNPWVGVPDRVVIGVEKAGLAGVIRPVCDRFQVPLIAPGGFSSYTLAWDTAKHVAAHDVLTFVYFYGDHDPSGLCIDESFERRLRQHVERLSPESSFVFSRAALTPEQIEDQGLRTHGVNVKDVRAEKFVQKYGNACADIDALDPNTLRQWVADSIRLHITDEDLERAKALEEADKKRLRQLLELATLTDDLERLAQQERVRAFVKSVTAK